MVTKKIKFRKSTKVYKCPCCKRMNKSIGYHRDNFAICPTCILSIGAWFGEHIRVYLKDEFNKASWKPKKKIEK